MIKDRKGQITVSLALLFLVLSMAILWLMDGIRLYTLEGLTKDALEGAGEEVTANYDQSLYQRYHLFALDPRERQYIESDGQNYIKMYLGDQQENNVKCGDLALVNEISVLDQGGIYLKTQINEWMKYKKILDVKQKVEEIAECYKEVKKQTEDAEKQILDAEKAEELYEKAEKSEEEETQPEKQEGKEDYRWKELKDTLDDILYSGILLYVTGDREVSNLQISLEDAPSSVENKTSDQISIPDISFSGMKELVKVLDNNLDARENEKLSFREEYLLLEYIEDNFRKWTDETWDFSSVLHYEMEYLVSGKENDKDNLKYVADRIFLIRFVMNYAYASTNSTLVSQANAIGAVVSGAFGMPVLEEAVKVVLLASLSYGESLLDVHSLFEGKKIPFMKDTATWTISFENAGMHLKEKTIVKEGTMNMDYVDYIKLLLGTKMNTNKQILRMADIMQSNIRLDEEGFLMKDALGAFGWEADFECISWFKGGDGSKTIINITGTAGY